MINTGAWERMTMAWARDWVARGAGIVGGCCGIGPEHIAELRAAL